MTRPAKLLIVDDEPATVDYLEEYLQGLGYETASAANGREALEKIAADSPDLILLDIVIPVIDSFRVCRYGLERLGRQNLKNIVEDLEVYRVLRPASKS